MIEEMVDGVGPLGFFLINTLISMVPVPAAGVMCLTAGAMFGLLQGLVIYFGFFLPLSHDERNPQEGEPCGDVANLS